MQFPQRDLTNQYISTSYQDVVQRYLTGSADYFLDGLGYVIAGIPTSSIGGLILTQDQTASWAETASYALTSSFELQHEVSSSWASESFFATSASWASESFHSIVSDISITASYSLYSELSNTSSLSILSEFADTSSLSFYSNFANTASYAEGADSSSAATSITFIPTLASTASYITSSNIIGTVTSALYSISSSYVSSSYSIINSLNSNTNLNLTSQNSYISLQPSGSEKLRLLSNGNITTNSTKTGISASNNSLYQVNQFWAPSGGSSVLALSSPSSNTMFVGVNLSGSNIGCESNFPIVFRTGVNYSDPDPFNSGIEAARITGSKMGIGVTSPINTLDVTGNISCSIITASVFNGTSNNSIISYPWFTRDIGTGILVGTSSYSSSNNTFLITGGGGDIWNTTDDFRYMFLNMSGNNNTMIACVTSQIGGDASWAKSGLMIRDSLDPSGSEVSLLTTPGNGLVLQSRNSASATTNIITQNYSLGLPIFMKMVQSNTVISCSWGTDGVNWTPFGATAITMSNASTPYMGLAVCAHNSTLLCTSNFQNVTIPSAVITIPIG